MFSYIIYLIVIMCTLKSHDIYNNNVTSLKNLINLIIYGNDNLIYCSLVPYNSNSMISCTLVE